MTLALLVIGLPFAVVSVWYGLEWLFLRWEQRRIDNNEVVAEPPY